MFCKYCGKEIEEGKEICAECMAKETETKVEEKKEEPVKEEVIVETPKVENNTSSNTSVVEKKSKLAAGLFGIFLGVFGVHNFYLGFTGKAVAQLLITVLSCGALSIVSAIWGLIEGIIILTDNDPKDAYGNELRD